MKQTVNKLLPKIKPSLFSSSSLNILLDTLSKVRQEYEEYYHFDSVFVCVDEKTLEIIEVEYEWYER